MRSPEECDAVGDLIDKASAPDDWSGQISARFRPAGQPSAQRPWIFLLVRPASGAEPRMLRWQRVW